VQSLALTEAQQTEVTVEITVPTGLQRRVLVTAFNAFGTEIFRGETRTDLTQAVVPVPILLERVLLPETVAASELANNAFVFDDGAAFGIADRVTLTFGLLTDGTGLLFTIVSSGGIASGNVTIETTTASSAQSRAGAPGQSRQDTPGTSCNFAVETSTYAPSAGPQAGENLLMRPCETDAIDGNLILVNASTGARSTSAPPTGAARIPPRTISIGSPPGPIPAGATFTVPVVLNTGTARVVSYLLELTVDAEVVEVVRIAGTAPFDALVTNEARFSRGVIKFAANNATFTPAEGLLSLARITFRTVGNSGDAARLTLSFPPEGMLVDATFQPVVGITFVDGLVEVQ
jgi:hypothetical protein